MQRKYFQNQAIKMTLEEIHHRQTLLNREFDSSAAIFAAEVTKRLLSRKEVGGKHSYLNSSCLHQ